MKYVFFDLDGTIIDSREGIIKAFKYATECLKLEYSTEIENMIGVPLGEVFSKQNGANFIASDIKELENILLNTK